ncbi:stage V sporulation protein S [Candidatus Bipolaricaulota bacterium]|nr:stage V sporulation protein S [Candidatus Bipolaricaulota bacterium]
MAEILKVSSTSDPSATAGALANTVREEGIAELQAIGPKAVNQAVKAVIIARGYMAPSGVDLIFIPSFVDVEIDHEKKTAMRLEVKTMLPFVSDRDREEEEQEERVESEGPEEVQEGKEGAGETPESPPGSDLEGEEDDSDILDI